MEIKAITGGVNTDESTIVNHVRWAIARQLPQVRPYQPQGTPVAILCGGPSLNETTSELRELVFQGWKIATVNGAYQWAIDRNFKPSLAIALDARAGNADFFATPVPGCKYLMASQCAPALFDTLADRDVWLFHALSYEEPETQILDAYYGPKRYSPVTGGSTVTLRAISLLRMIGFLRMDLFGFDSCWSGHAHHAYQQAMNDSDKRFRVRMHADGEPDDRDFWVAPWHLRQWEDFQLLVKARGAMFDLHVHGDGLIAHGMRTGARIVREDRHDGGTADHEPTAEDSRRPVDAGAVPAEDCAGSRLEQSADLAGARG